MKNKITTISLFILISLLLAGCNLLGDTDQEVGTDFYKLGFMVEGCDNRAGETIRAKLDYDTTGAISNFSYTIPDPYHDDSLIFYLSLGDEFYDFSNLGGNKITNITIWWDANNNGQLDSSGLGYSESLYMVAFTNIIEINAFETNNGVVLFNAKGLFNDNY